MIDKEKWMAEKRGTCSAFNMMHDPHMPCPGDVYQHSSEKPSKNFKKEVMDANKLLIAVALVLFAAVIIFWIVSRR